jgi:large subunit ribosomal protein L30
MEKEKNTHKDHKEGNDKRIAVVRVRGLANLRYVVKDTFKRLNLHNKNWCVVVEDTPITQGMIAKVKDYITWGEVTPEIFEELVKKRGEKYVGRTKDPKSLIEYNKFFVFGNIKYKRYFRLAPPKKGYGRKGIKNNFTDGGTLGYRGDKINELIKRMI